MEFNAQTRSVQGSSASRRLRRAGRLPGVVYGGQDTPAVSIELDHNEIYHALRKEAFHSSILDMKLDGKTQKVLLRGVQWHAYKPFVLHIDFQRVSANQEITVKVPLHFLNEEISPAVKLGSAVVSRVQNEIEVNCLPANLPQFIEVDLATLEAASIVHAADLKLPKGVTLANHTADLVIVSSSAAKASSEGDEASAE